MLRQASVSDLITDRVNRDKGYIVITMRRYPRFVARELRDEYLHTMSPDVKLHEAWLGAKRRNHDHNGAFARVQYEHHFTVSDPGWADLQRLCRKARQRTVYLVCQCRVGDRCHREMLLLLARELFKIPAEEPKNDYPEFRKRFSLFRRQLRPRPGKPALLKLKAPKRQGLNRIEVL